MKSRFSIDFLSTFLCDFVLPAAMNMAAGWPSWPARRSAAAAAAAAIGAAAYYQLCVRAKPSVRAGKTVFNDKILQRLVTLHQPYSPPFWAANAWVQLAVILARLRRMPPSPFTRTVLSMQDGGSTALDWLEDASLSPEAPVLMVLPTITGTSKEYAQLAAAARNRGWRTAVAVRRGHLGTPLTSPRVNLLGCTSDLRVQLEAAASRFPGAPLLCIGLSAGTGLLVRYLGEEGAASRFTAAAALCPGYNTAPPNNAFARMGSLVQSHLLASLRRFFLVRNEAALRHLPGWEAMNSATSLADYQKAAHALEGYADAESMYEATNPMEHAANIVTPLLVVNAMDDPVCLWQNVKDHEHIFDTPRDRLLVATARGSHCCHLEGVFWPAPLGWADRLALEYLEAALLLRGPHAHAEVEALPCNKLAS
jgi:predicted alpha/beta-fold hydrolase